MLCWLGTSPASRTPWRSSAGAGSWCGAIRARAMAEAFVHSLRVRYAECDPQGVVFNAHYLAYLDASMTELWRAAFGGYTVMLERGIDMVVVQSGAALSPPRPVRRAASARGGGQRMGNTSISTAHRISHEEIWWRRGRSTTCWSIAIRWPRRRFPTGSVRGWPPGRTPGRGVGGRACEPSPAQSFLRSSSDFSPGQYPVRY